MGTQTASSRLDQRRDALIAAARKLFLEQGFERTTLGQVVQEAGGSLATIYKLFGNKEGLFDAVVEEKMRPGVTIVREMAALNASPAETLTRIGMGLHARFLHTEDVALTRLVIARSIGEPDFAKLFFETKAQRTRLALVELFSRWKAQGVAMLYEPEILAELFFGLLINDMQQEAISHGAAKRAPAESLRCRIEFFLRGAGMKSAGSVQFD
ncbi:TetR/AcrR family transcriptional regulator [Erythrobacter litoralis]|uniref:TetR/AcrR family transcriptional regulator n=1 Tax=Erythrobacter litoralis TaxID=39960 RepID=UPI0024352AAB|nr:TetR/AcrR family transcriptional regulator [Erythrobacter litoralis]